MEVGFFYNLLVINNNNMENLEKPVCLTFTFNTINFYSTSKEVVVVFCESILNMKLSEGWM